MTAIILMIGAVLWIISEIMELVSGGFTDMNSTVSAVAFLAIATGMETLWQAEGQNKVGKAGLGLVSLGMALFAIVAFQAIGSGITNDAEISGSTLFLAAGSAVSLGALALSYWLITASPFAKVLGIVLLAATAFTLGVAFVPALVSLQPLSNLVLAGTLFWLGWTSRLFSLHRHP